MSKKVEIDITPVNAEIVIALPDTESVRLDLLPVLIPTAAAESLPTDPLAYYILAKD